MRNLLALLCGLGLGLSAASALNENIADKYRLQWNDCSHGHNRPAILFPERWLTKMNDTARRQAAFANTPPPQFSTVIDRLSKQNQWGIDGAWLLSLQY